MIQGIASWLELLVFTSIKGSILLLLVAFLLKMTIKNLSSLRHLLRFLSLSAFAILPVLSLVAPNLKLPLPIKTPFLSTWLTTQKISETSTYPLTLVAVTPYTAEANISVRHLVLIAIVSIWLIGLLFCLFRLTSHFNDLRKLQHSSFDSGESWYLQLESLKRDLNVKRSAYLGMSHQGLSPMTFGVLKPVILLPESASNWTVEQKQIVLLHELAHIKRIDWLWQLSASLICAFNWFNPLVWLTAKQLRYDSERASDTLVLMAGKKATSYASILLSFANHPAKPHEAVGMVPGSPLYQRIQDLLKYPPASPSKATFSVFTFTALCCITLLGSLQVSPEPRYLPLASSPLLHINWTNARSEKLELYLQGVKLEGGKIKSIHPDGFFFFRDFTNAIQLSATANNNGDTTFNLRVIGQTVPFRRPESRWLQDHLIELHHLTQDLNLSDSNSKVLMKGKQNQITVITKDLKIDILQSSPERIPPALEWFKTTPIDL